MESPSPPSPLSARIVLGIDPGTRVVGYGAVGIAARGPVLLGSGAIRVPASVTSVAERLGRIRVELDRILADLRPGVVVVEEAFAHRNVQSALRIGEARGVVLSGAAAAGIEVVQIPPAVAKKALVGFGGAHKTQVAAMVARLLNLAKPPEPLDATDALGLALTHVLRRTSIAAGH
jgi:crossover junction endodeoxyribonuclease RuvC